MFLRLYVIALPLFLAIDMVWLGVIAKSLYQKQIGPLMRPDVQWGAAILFYLLFIAGLVFFVIAPSVEKKDWMFALGAGALFGLITYATYDLTNLATLRNWPMVITIIDLLWGATIAAVVSVSSFFIARKFGI
jgi:uncharacterized membrane protein